MAGLARRAIGQVVPETPYLDEGRTVFTKAAPTRLKPIFIGNLDHSIAMTCFILKKPVLSILKNPKQVLSGQNPPPSSFTKTVDFVSLAFPSGTKKSADSSFTR